MTFTYISRLFVEISHVERELHGATGTEAIARAITIVVHLVDDVVAVQRNETDAMGEELVEQHRRVSVDLDGINGHRGRLGNHAATQCICHTEIRIFDNEFDHIASEIRYLNARLIGVRHSLAATAAVRTFRSVIQRNKKGIYIDTLTSIC